VPAPHTSWACRPHRSTAFPPGVVTAAGSQPPRAQNGTSRCRPQILADSPATSRFATAEPARRAAAPAYRHDATYFRERREALSHLRGFVERDLVVVTDGTGREHPGVVLRPRCSPSGLYMI